LLRLLYWLWSWVGSSVTSGSGVGSAVCPLKSSTSAPSGAEKVGASSDVPSGTSPLVTSNPIAPRASSMSLFIKLNLVINNAKLVQITIAYFATVSYGATYGIVLPS
jgi:hypothetical protein